MLNMTVQHATFSFEDRGCSHRLMAEGSIWTLSRDCILLQDVMWHLKNSSLGHSFDVSPCLPQCGGIP